MAVPAAPVITSVQFNGGTLPWRYQVTWTQAPASPSIAGFQVERCVGAGCTGFTSYASYGSGVTTNPVGLIGDTPGDWIRYRMRSHNADGVSPWAYYKYRVGTSKVITLWSGSKVYGTETVPPSTTRYYFEVFTIPVDQLPTDAVLGQIEPRLDWTADYVAGVSSVGLGLYSSGVARTGERHSAITDSQFEGQIQFTGEFAAMGGNLSVDGGHKTGSTNFASAGGGVMLKQAYNETTYNSSTNQFPNNTKFTRAEALAHQFGILLVRGNSNTINPYTFSILDITKIEVKVYYAYQAILGGELVESTPIPTDYSTPCCGNDGTTDPGTGVTPPPEDLPIIPGSVQLCTMGGTISGAATPAPGELWLGP